MPELMPVPGCACVEPDGNLVVYAEHIERLGLGLEELGVVYVTGAGVAYVRGDGKTAWAHPFDNGADYFVEGLARTVRGAKIGFINETLDIVIEPTWDFAFPFNSGLAIVCEGCKTQPVCPECDHSEVVGGRWGYIDTRGEVVIPVSNSRDSLPAQDTIAPNEPAPQQ